MVVRIGGDHGHDVIYSIDHMRGLDPGILLMVSATSFSLPISVLRMMIALGMMIGNDITGAAINFAVSRTVSRFTCRNDEPLPFESVSH